VLVAAAVAAAVVGLGAAALAATGKLHVAIGGHSTPTHAPAEFVVPPKSHGIAVVAGGKLWLRTRSGLRIEGMPVSAAELSPRALYAVVGLGSSLVALAPGQRRAWVHRTDGHVVSAAWSRDGLKIAYVVRSRTGAQLRLIEGDGDHDRLLDPGAATRKPEWRRNSLALTYVRHDGRLATFDLANGRRILGGRVAWRGPSERIAIPSPRGDFVAVAIRRPNGVLEVRILPRRERHGAPALLLRARVPRSRMSISWR
jgi:hypothetical protein